jgi:hypothetical protein
MSGEARLTRKEFEELKEDFKWEFVSGLYKLIDDLQIKADKNCEECEAVMLAVDDLNIDLLFEDWRNCAENCDHCTKDVQKQMCQTQFELINLLANSLASLRQRQNGLANLVLKRDSKGAKLLKQAEDDQKAAEEKAAGLFS